MPSPVKSSFALQDLGRASGSTNITPADNTSEPQFGIPGRQLLPTLQHKVWKALLGDLFDLDASIVVAQALSMQEGVQRNILELGSGSGNWAVEMARRYPHSQIIGIDLAPEKPRFAPRSCTFETGDITRDVHIESLKAGKFDLIHTRSVLEHIADPLPIIHKIAQWLRPGGTYLYAGGDYVVLDQYKNPVQVVNPKVGEMGAGQSWFALLLSEVAQITYASRPQSAWSGTRVEGLLKESGSFEKMQVRSHLLPINWAGKAEDEIVEGPQLGVLACKNFIEYIASVRPLLSEHLNDEHRVEELITRSTEEISKPTLHLYLRFQTAWACRK